MSEVTDSNRIAEISNVLYAEGRPMEAREIAAHCDLIEGPTTCASLLHRMYKAGQVRIDETSGKRALYRLANQAPSSRPKESPDLRPRSVRVREWVAQQTEPFTAKACTEALDEKVKTVTALLLYMAKTGELVKEPVPGSARLVQFRHPRTDTASAEKSQRQEAPSPEPAQGAGGERPSTGVPAGDRGQPQAAEPRQVDLPDEARRWVDAYHRERNPAEPGIERMLLTDEGHILIVGRSGDQVEIMPTDLRRLLVLCDAAGHLLEGIENANANR